jgi:hypothetical protein
MQVFCHHCLLRRRFRVIIFADPITEGITDEPRAGSPFVVPSQRVISGELRPVPCHR